MTEQTDDAPPRDEPATPTDSAQPVDGDEDFEDLEFLLDDIEDQIAPLGR